MFHDQQYMHTFNEVIYQTFFVLLLRGIVQRVVQNATSPLMVIQGTSHVYFLAYTVTYMFLSIQIRVGHKPARRS